MAKLLLFVLLVLVVYGVIVSKFAEVVFVTARGLF